MSCLPGHRLLSLPEGCWAWTGCRNNPPLTAVCCLCHTRHLSEHPPRASSSRTELSTVVWFVTVNTQRRGQGRPAQVPVRQPRHVGQPLPVTCFSTSVGPLPGPRLDTAAERSLAGEPRRGEIRYQTDGRKSWRVAEGFLEESLDTRRCWGQDPSGRPLPRVVPALRAVGRMGFRGYCVTGVLLLS